MEHGFPCGRARATEPADDDRLTVLDSQIGLGLSCLDDRRIGTVHGKGSHTRALLRQDMHNDMIVIGNLRCDS